MTFAQRRNRLTTHFSERIPVVKRRISVVVTRLDFFFQFVQNTKTSTPHFSAISLVFLNLQSAIRVQSIVQANGPAVSQTCGGTGVMRFPPARRSRSPYYRSAGHRRSSLRTTLSRGMGWSSGLE